MPKPGARYIVESAARPLQLAVREGTGSEDARWRVVGVRSRRALTPATTMREVPPLRTSTRRSARRYDGSQAALACFSGPKACEYRPLRNDAPRRDDAPPHHPPPLPLAMASITSSASAVLGRRSRSQSSRPASIAKISVETIKSLKPKIADGARITAVLRYTASSIHLPL